MALVNPVLVSRMARTLQVGDLGRPHQEVRVYRPGVAEPWVLPGVMQIEIDERVDRAVSEATITIENEFGRFSPDYARWKFPDLHLPPSGYAYVLWPNSKVEIYLWYGDRRPATPRWTGWIDKVTPSGDGTETLTIRCRDAMRFLVDTVIEPEGGLSMTYPRYGEPPWVASDIIADLALQALRKANQDLNVIVDRTVVIENGEEVPYVIPGVKFNFGEYYGDAIQFLAGTVFQRVYATRTGAIRSRHHVIRGQNDEPDWEASDWVNLTDADYEIDFNVVRTRLVVFSAGGAELFEDPSLMNIARGWHRTASIEVPWADTPAKRRLAAQNIFLQLHRLFRRMSVGMIGNPYLEIDDLIQLKNVATTAVMKYQVVGIRTSFSPAGYFDVAELEFGVDFANIVSRPLPFDKRLVSLRLSPSDVEVQHASTVVFHVAAVYSDGTEEDVTPYAVWEVDRLDLLAHVGAGAYQTQGAGTARVLVEYRGLTASARVTIRA